MATMVATMKQTVSENWTPKAFVLDVDGVMTNGQFSYTEDGKAFKIFGPDDHDGLLLLRNKLDIWFVTGDRKGYEISKRRIVDDMKFSLDLVSTINRVEWIADHWLPEDVIYMGDGILDSVVFAAVGYGICPSDGFYAARQSADFVTQHGGGNRAVAEACLHILQRFYGLSDITQLNREIEGGEWAK